MYEANLKLACKNPVLIKKSIEPDIKNDAETQIVIKVIKAGEGLKTDEGFIEIRIKSKKLNHLKAIINSYIALISMLKEAKGV